MPGASVSATEITAVAGVAIISLSAVVGTAVLDGKRFTTKLSLKAPKKT